MQRLAFGFSNFVFILSKMSYEGILISENMLGIITNWFEKGLFTACAQRNNLAIRVVQPTYE